MEERYKRYVERISSIVSKERIYTDDLRTLAWGTDAGFYRYTPRVVVRAENEEEVALLLSEASALRLPVTFRAAGTSLSGQSVTDSILIVAGKHWERYSVSDDALSITLEPGIVGAKVDEILRPYGRTFTPDPASKSSAMVGGIVMNNASGMSCGTHANSDKVLQSIRIVLADGTVLDTGDEQSREAFARSHPQFIAGIEKLRDRVRSNPELVARIKRKYSIKNVTGLNIAPLVAYDDPMDIITHLMVGSEGTLAFASRFRMKTGHLHSHSASAMLYFADMRVACEAIVALKNSVVECAEMLDKKSLASVNDTTGENLTAVLIRTAADSQEQLDANISAINRVLEQFELYVPARFTSDPAEYGKYWAIRAGIFPSVGGTRPPGTTVLIEDVAFHIDDLPTATVDLADLLERHGYDDSCIYGHALEGNYHFIISQSFDTEEEVARYRHLMEDIVTLVIDKYDGSLKAEHGTGRNMAPFVRKEWGDEAWEIMREIKHLFDPDGIINPGVIFNDDPECYIKNIKPMPLTSESVDKCIECGFCEVNCVSCGFSLSSRQRIVICREMSRLRKSGEDDARLRRLEHSYRYLGDATCAADGLCSMSCPMKINVGDLTHELREARVGKSGVGYNTGAWCSRNLNKVRSGLKAVLYVAGGAHAVLGDSGTNAVGRVLHKVGMPLWTSSLPHAHRPKVSNAVSSDKKVVYFPSCLNQTMGRSRGVSEDLTDVTVRLLNRAGWEVMFPPKMKDLCCGMIWESKGMPDIADRKTLELEEALLEASENGRYPVVCDQSPCLHRMLQKMTRLKPVELLTFIHDNVVNELNIIPTNEPIAIHLTCSSRLMGINDKILRLARMCSSHVIVPEGVGCCGFAGDKGFTHPELNAFALRKLKPQIEVAGVKRGFSNSRTCEIGLATNSGVPYQSLVYLIEQCSVKV